MLRDYHMEPRIINEILYYPEIGVIHDVLDDYESHGILAWNLYFMFGNVGQGTGNRRSSTLAGQAEIQSVLDALGASTLKELKGKPAIALHVGHRGGLIGGVANADDPSRVSIFITPA